MLFKSLTLCLRIGETEWSSIPVPIFQTSPDRRNVPKAFTELLPTYKIQSKASETNGESNVISMGEFERLSVKSSWEELSTHAKSHVRGVLQLIVERGEGERGKWESLAASSTFCALTIPNEKDLLHRWSSLTTTTWTHTNPIMKWN